MPEAERSFIEFPFARHREVGWRFLLLLLVFDLAYSAFVNLVVFELGWLNPLAAATQGLVQPGLVSYLVKIPLFFALLFAAGGLRPQDVGLRKSRLPAGVAGVFLLWLALQLAGIAVALIGGSGLAMAPRWAEADLSRLAGIQLANGANALFEEVFFRGFLLIQFCLMLRDRLEQVPSQGRIFLAVVLSQLLFAVSHIPIRLYQGLPPAQLGFDQFMLLGIGALHALIFLRTGNLFVAMALHFLANEPMALFLRQGIAGNVVLALGLVILFLWGRAIPQAVQIVGAGAD